MPTVANATQVGIDATAVDDAARVVLLDVIALTGLWLRRLYR